MVHTNDEARGFFFLHIVWMMKPKSGNDRGKVEDGRLMHNRRSADVYRSIGEAKQLPANAREKIQKTGDSQHMLAGAGTSHRHTYADSKLLRNLLDLHGSPTAFVNL